LGLTNAKDIDIWDYARKNDFVIVTFDADFYDIGLVNGCPPKIVWLRTGNLTTNQVADLLRKRQSQITEFCSQPELKGKDEVLNRFKINKKFLIIILFV